MTFIQGEDTPPKALELIVQNSQAELIMHPRIIDLVNKKWECFARRIFFRRFFVTFVYLLIFLITTILDQTRIETVKVLCQKLFVDKNFFLVFIFDYRQKVKVKKWW